MDSSPAAPVGHAHANRAVLTGRRDEEAVAAGDRRRCGGRAGCRRRGCHRARCRGRAARRRRDGHEARASERPPRRRCASASQLTTAAAGEFLGAGVRLLAPAVLVLVVQLQRRRRVEAVEGAVERRRIHDAQGEAGGRVPPLVIDERPGWSGRRTAKPAKRTPALRPRSLPTRRWSARAGPRLRRSPLRSRRRPRATRARCRGPPPPPPRR